MSFLSVLKKIGQTVNAFDGFIPVYGPILHAITSTIPGGADAALSTGISIAQDGLALASHIVIDAEVAGQAIGAAGSQKAQLAAPALAQLFLDLPLLKGKKPKDPAAFKAHAAALGGAIADLLNDFEG